MSKNIRPKKQPIIKNIRDIDFRKFLVRIPKQPIIKNIRKLVN